MPRPRHRLPLLPLAALACLLAGNARRASCSDGTVEPRYPLAYPPYLVARAPDVSSLKKLLDRTPYRPFLSLARAAWPGGLPLLKNHAPEAWRKSLEAADVRDLTYFLLPPSRFGAPPRAVLLFTGEPLSLPMEAEKRGQRGERRILVSDRAHRDAFAQTPPAGTDAPWRETLERFLAAPSPTPRLWIEPAWAQGVALLYSGVDMRERLRAAHLPVPPALEIALHPGAERVAVVCRPFTSSSEAAATDVDTPALPALADDYACTLRFSLNRLRAGAANWPDGNTMTPATTGGLWRLALRGLSLIAPYAAEDVAYRTGRLQQLTGLHLHEHVLTPLGDRLVLAFDRRGGTGPDWLLAAEVADAPALARAFDRTGGWTAFFRARNEIPFILETQAAPPGAIRVFVLRWKEAPVARLVLTAHHLLAFAPGAGEEKSAAAALLSQTIPPQSNPWLAWRLHPPPRPAGELLAMKGMNALLGPLPPAERGAILAGPEGPRLAFSGAAAPFVTAAVLEKTGDRVAHYVAEQERTLPRQRTEGRMRLLLAAQQVYRHLDLGRLNGREPGYAPALEALVRDKAENGAPLAGMYSALFDPPEEERTPYDELFALLVRHLAAGRALDGYRFLFIDRRGGRALDRRTAWGLLAAPVAPGAAPALAIFEDGTLWRQVGNETIDAAAPVDFPAAPGDAGWTRE